MYLMTVFGFNFIIFLFLKGKTTEETVMKLPKTNMIIFNLLGPARWVWPYQVSKQKVIDTGPREQSFPYKYIC